MRGVFPSSDEMQVSTIHLISTVFVGDSGEVVVEIHNPRMSEFTGQEFATFEVFTTHHSWIVIVPGLVIRESSRRSLWKKVTTKLHE